MWTEDTVFKGIVGFNILNSLDAIFTLAWILNGFASEGNPMMGILLDLHPALFFFVKVFLVGSIVSAIIWRARKENTAKVGIIMALIIYGLILFYHIGFIGYLLFN